MVLSQKRNYTAIFAENDKMANIICATAENNGIHIPRDLSIVGYDDASFIDNSPIRLTTIHQPIYEMGATSISLLLQRIAGDTSEKQTVILNSHLVERESVLPLR
ncbi:substrate-binding domain-containing protein [bacterium]|nr:substrate-binding domain-containing protein [bacterium]